MSNQTTNQNPSGADQLLDLLLDALIERQRARRTQAPAPQPKEPPAEAKPAQKTTGPSLPPARPEPLKADQQRPFTPPPLKPAFDRPPGPGDKGWEPPPKQPSIQMGKLLGRMAMLLVALLVLINIPVTRYGVSLARILPESSSLIIRDGLILKGSGPEIYKLDQDKLRWISSMDAFEHLGLTWGDVHVVEDGFLDKFEMGQPLHILLKCSESPHIYRLENDQKRWIQDMDTFEAEGHVWEDVRFVTCDYLRDLPTGPSIPEDAGPAPEP